MSLADSSHHPEDLPLETVEIDAFLDRCPRTVRDFVGARLAALRQEKPFYLNREDKNRVSAIRDGWGPRFKIAVEKRDPLGEFAARGWLDIADKLESGELKEVKTVLYRSGAAVVRESEGAGILHVS